MTSIPKSWRRGPCPWCGRETLLAPTELGSHHPGDAVRLDATPRRLFVAGEFGEASLVDCYTPHMATCDYRGPACSSDT